MRKRKIRPPKVEMDFTDLNPDRLRRFLDSGRDGAAVRAVRAARRRGYSGARPSDQASLTTGSLPASYQQPIQ